MKRKEDKEREREIKRRGDRRRNVINLEKDLEKEVLQKNAVHIYCMYIIKEYKSDIRDRRKQGRR